MQFMIQAIAYLRVVIVVTIVLIGVVARSTVHFCRFVLQFSTLLALILEEGRVG
jgi:hypothetical protein